MLRIGPGLYAGACLSAVLWSFWSQWGASLTATAGLVLASTIAFVTGVRGIRRNRRGFLWQGGRTGVAAGLALGVVAAPYVSALTLRVLAWVPIAALESPLVSTTIAGLAALATIGPTIVLLCAYARGPRSPASPFVELNDAWLWGGMALSVLLMPLTVGLWWGLERFGWMLALGSIGWTIQDRMRRRRETPAGEAGAPVAREADGAHPWGLIDVVHSVSGLLIGAAAALCLQVGAQLVAGMSYIVFAELAGLLGGVATGLLLRASRLRRTRRPQSPFGAGILFAAGSLVVLTATFGWLTDLHLWLSASVSQVWLLMPGRAVLAALTLLPCGLALVLAADEWPHQVRGHFAADLAQTAAASAVGFVALRFWQVDSVSMVPWFVVAAAGVGLLLVWVARPVFRPQPIATVAVCAGLMLAGAGAWHSGYDPARSARLLFSTTAFTAYRGGMEPDELPALDDGRLVATRCNGRSIWTVWKHHGAQLQFRENGIPRHITSLDLAVCPQSSAELLPAVIPLVLHPEPRHVLLTGLGGTATLQSCLAFPVLSLTCTEPDEALVSLARDVVGSDGESDPTADPRVRLLRVDPVLAAAANDRAYDVIIVAATQPALFSSVSGATTEYYARLAGKLRPGGVLCQRFQYVDFGAWPLRQIASALKAVFPRLMLLETAPGEVLLVAGLLDGPRVDAALAARAQSAHVRRVMSQAGWDWSVLLALAAVDTEHTSALDVSAAASAAADGRFAFRLAPELLRWGAKLEEIQQLLAADRSRMLDWIGAIPAAEEAAQRLADVGEQHRTISEHPEQFWSYRKTLKQRLQQRPRSVIVPVSHEGLQRRLHPEDQRRKDYLLALGRAARQAKPRADAIAEVARFVEPFDPLVSYFVHHEAAYLLARSSTPDRRAELAHRLHTVYYGAGSDRSVRNVVAALRLVLDHPEATDSTAERWDHMNALLEVLRQRWAARLHSADQSRYTAADLGETLTAAKQALERMDELYTGVSVSADAWQMRRGLLERELIRPLRAAQVQQVERRTAATPSALTPTTAAGDENL